MGEAGKEQRRSRKGLFICQFLLESTDLPPMHWIPLNTPEYAPIGLACCHPVGPVGFACWPHTLENPARAPMLPHTTPCYPMPWGGRACVQASEKASCAPPMPWGGRACAQASEKASCAPPSHCAVLWHSAIICCSSYTLCQPPVTCLRIYPAPPVPPPCPCLPATPSARLVHQLGLIVLQGCLDPFTLLHLHR